MRSLIAAVILLSGCTTSEPVTAASPRQLNEHAQDFDGKHVSVRGMLVLGTNGRSIYQSQARFDEWIKDLNGPGAVDFAAYRDDCLTLINVDQLLEQAESFNRLTVTLSGTFVAKYYGENSIDFQKCGPDSALLVDWQSVKRVLAE